MILRILIIFSIVIIPIAVTAIENDTTAVSDDYRLSTGDKIRIQVYNEEDLYLETRVSDTGIISYPFVGNIKIIGKTPSQIEEYIDSKLRGDYLIDPKVSVEIIEYRQFYVNGEVQAPGGFPFQPGITVRKAISVAGGFRERAARDQVFIIREGQADSTPARVELDEKVRPGDIITVEESFF